MGPKAFIISLLFLALAFASTLSQNASSKNLYSIGRGLFTRLHLLDPHKFSANANDLDEWFEQRLDHFNALETGVWAQRYLLR